MVGALGGYLGEMASDPRTVYKVGLHSRRVLLAMGDLVIGWLLQRQAEVALHRLSENLPAAEQAFYQGKLAAARFFAGEVLPRFGSDRRIVERAGLDLMELPEAAF
jgi:hypothetical protein